MVTTVAAAQLWCLCLLLLCSAALHVRARDDAGSCREQLSAFLAANQKEAQPQTADGLLYFLHVPRTAGRTFHACFLKVGTPQSRRCPKAYDHLRIDTSLPRCHLLSSHDDFSVVERLPENTAVVSQFRDPVDRVLSAYEFAVEVAARQAARTKPLNRPVGKIMTDDVWPWSHLVPFFADDMRARAKALKAVPSPPQGVWINAADEKGKPFYHNAHLNVSKWEIAEEERVDWVPDLEPYDNPLAMSLAEFVRHPIAQELLHEGEFFQVLGITNYSHYAGSEQLRACVASDADVRQQLHDFAVARVRRFAHVGVTSMLNESVLSAAATLNLPVDGLAYAAGESKKANIEKPPPPRRRASKDEVVEEGEPDAYEPEPGDLHHMAAEARRGRRRLRQQKKAYNDVIKQPDLRRADLMALRKEINSERRKLQAQQRALRSARMAAQEENDGRALLDEDGGGDATLELMLGQEYQRCASRAQNKAKVRRQASLRSLTMPDGRFMEFSKPARAAIPKQIIQEIRDRNTIDTELFELAKGMLLDKLQQYRAAGRLKPLPDITPMQHRHRQKIVRTSEDKQTDEL